MTAKRAAAIPWIVLGLMVAYNAWYVGRYSANIPRADEWRDVFVLLGDEPLTLEWLWRPHSVHRIPLPRLIRFTLYRLSGRDFRSALVFNVAVMALAAALLIRATTRARGHPSAMDAIFPLLLVGPGNFMTFLWAFQVQFAASAALFLATVAIIVAQPNAPSPRRLALVGLFLFLQIFTGAQGAALALPLMAWLALALYRRLTDRRREWWLAAAFCSGAALVIALYPIALPKAGSPPTPSPWLAVQTFFQFLSTALAIGENPLWVLRASIVAAATGWAALALAKAWRHRPAERARIAGLAAGLAGALLVAAFVAVGRAELTAGAGLHSRYTTLSIALVCLAYLTFTLYPAGPAPRTVVAATWAVAALTSLIGTLAARGYGEFRRAQLEGLEADARRGLPIEAIAARNAPAVFQYHQPVALYLRRLLAHGAWPFERYQPDARVRAQPIARQPVALDALTLHDVRREGALFRPTGPQPQLRLQLPQPTPLAELQLRYSLAGPQQLMRLEVRWTGLAPGGRVFRKDPGVGSFPVYPARAQTLIAPIYDSVSDLRIDLDRRASHLEVQALVLVSLAPDWIPADGLMVN